MINDINLIVSPAGYVPGAGAAAAAPLMYNQEGTPAPVGAPGYHPSASPNHTLHTTTTTTGTGTGTNSVYQPPPPDGSNPFATPYGTPAHSQSNVQGYQPPPPEMGGWSSQGHGYPGAAGVGTNTTAGNTASVYGTAQTNTNSMYAPPTAPPGPGAYKGHAEVY